jgi:hypothetical protein
MQRRTLIAAGLVGPLSALADDGAVALLRQGGLVVAFRHALAPGTFDPPGFRLGECSTQRNLSDEGRAQARRIGEWFRVRGLQPDRVRSSPWCRCLDTATLAFGAAEPWPPLGSPHGQAEQTNAASLQALQAELAAAARAPGRFQAWVTHAFVLSALAGTGTASGEGLLLGLGPDGRAVVRGRIVVA